MPRSEKDRLAAEFEERRIDFEMALSDKRKYPVQWFRVVVKAVNGMTDYLKRERKRVPEKVV
jgi:hypothetical protein